MNSIIEFPIDFKGQQLSEFYLNLISYSSIPICFSVALITQELSYLVYTFIISIIFSWLVLLPNYPIYNQNPETWLSVKYDL